MEQLPVRMELNLLEQRLHQQIIDLQDIMDTRVTALENPASGTLSFSSSPNMIPNSCPEWSTLAYGTAGTTPATAGDTNHEAYNWKYQTAAATDLSASAALIGSGHSGYGALNADAGAWDRTNGYFLLGSSTTNYDICCPLPTDFIFPGLRFHVYFEASVTQSDTNINDTEFYCGFWDNTAGQRKWIEGSFTPTASVFGVAGARTLNYKIHARTDSGTEMLSSELTVTTAPATLTSSNHVRLNFSGSPGFIEYTIYRKDGSNYYRVGQVRNSIDLQFFDMVESGSTVVPVTGYPSVTDTTPKAYAKTLDLDPGDVGAFNVHTLTIDVPTSYNRSNTGNLQQYFRFGLSGLVGSGSEREVAIRHIAVSQGYGLWSRSPQDLSAASGPSTAATSGATGGGGGVVITPPGGGSGGPTCLALDTDIETSDGVTKIAFIEKGDFLKVGDVEVPVLGTRTGTVQFMWEFELECGRVLRCSDTHRWITGPKDRRGKAAGILEAGESLLTVDGLSKIVRKTKLLGQWTVKQISLPAPHLFIANGVYSHNRKREDQDIIIF